MVSNIHDGINDERDVERFTSSIRLAADDISTLRAVDVERVLADAPSAPQRLQLAVYMARHRVDLIDEIVAVFSDVFDTAIGPDDLMAV